MSNPRPWISIVLIFCLLGSVGQVTVPSAAMAATPKAQKDEAAALSRVAAAKAGAGEFAKAADLFHDAYKIDPDFVAYLYSAARAEDKAGMLVEAERDYEAFIRIAPSKHDKIGDAAKNLAAVKERKAKQAQPKPVEEAPKPVVAKPETDNHGANVARPTDEQPKPPEKAKEPPKLAVKEKEIAKVEAKEEAASKQATKAEELAKPDTAAAQPQVSGPAGTRATSQQEVESAAEPSVARQARASDSASGSAKWRRRLGWTSVGTGFVALVVGGVYALTAQWQDKDLRAKLTDHDGNGLVDGVAQSDAGAASSQINEGRLRAIILVSSGLAFAGLGAWLELGRSDSRVTITPTGIMLTHSF